MANELLELNQIRLEDDLTYGELAEAIGIDASAVFRFLNSPNRKRRPHDRTLFKIRRFLDQRQSNAKPQRRGASA